MAIKNPTQWEPPSGKGYVITIGFCFLVDNLGNFLVDNSQNNLVTTPTYTVPKYATLWTGTGV
jgi:hypothetical protein